MRWGGCCYGSLSQGVTPHPNPDSATIHGKFPHLSENLAENGAIRFRREIPPKRCNLLFQKYFFFVPEHSEPFSRQFF